MEQCNVTIWEQAWRKYIELTETKCDAPSKLTSSTSGGLASGAPVVGGRQRISNKDPEALKALNFAVAQLNQDAVNERAYFKPAHIYNTYK